MIPQESVKATGGRWGFREMLTHATNLIVDIDRYIDSIAMVVTKTEKPTEHAKANDERIIRRVATFLNRVKKELNDSDPHKGESKRKFIDGLLKETDGKHDRIRIHRFVAEAGPLKNMPVQEQEKQAIKHMVHENLRYQAVRSDDFGFSISPKSKLRIVDLLSELQSALINTVSFIGDELKKYYWQQEKQTTDLNVMYEKMRNANDIMAKNFSNDLSLFRDELFQSIDSLKQRTHFDSKMKHFDAQLEMIYFLMAVSNTSLSSFFKISDGLSNTKRYFADSEQWYDFLKSVHEDISAYGAYQKIKQYNQSSLVKDINQFIRELGDIREMPFRECRFDIFVHDFGLHTKSKLLENANVNAFKLKMFVALLNQLTMPDVVSCSDKLTVKGYNVNLTEYIANITCRTNVIEIFALNKIFFDSSIDKKGEQIQMALIAPIWEFINSPLSIIVEGARGEDYETSARDGYAAIDGETGKPGRAGGHSGHFFGIGGNFINDATLHIDASGGNGGSGQNGGRGK